MKANKVALPNGDAPFVSAPGIRRAGIASRVFHRIPFDKVNWPTSSFLIGTFLLSLTLVPAYIWYFGLDRFQITLFLVMFLAVGFSITLGYHRLYSHLTFQAHWSAHGILRHNGVEIGKRDFLGVR